MGKLSQIILLIGFSLFCGICLSKPARTSRQDGANRKGPKPQQRLIQWIDKPWVDPRVGLTNSKGELFGEDGMATDGSGASSGAGNSGGSGNGKGNGNGKGKGSSGAGNGKIPGSLTMDENAPKGDKGSIPGKSESGRQDMSSSGGGSVAFPLWYPVCMFIDQTISSGEGNAAVKGLVDQAAACGVNLVVFPITIKSNYGVEPGPINAGSQASCNATEALGVPRASTTVCVNNPLSAGLMCGDEPKDAPKTAGCAQLAGPGAGSVKDSQLLGLKRFSGGGAAPSIERSGACTAGIVGHEALGHSMWGHPNGNADGNGIGLTLLEDKYKYKIDPVSGISSPLLASIIDEIAIRGGQPAPARLPEIPLMPGVHWVDGRAVAAEGEQSIKGGSWSGTGCGYMQGAAFANDGRWRWDANRSIYYVRQEDDRQWDLMGGQKLWPGQSSPPGGGPPLTPPPSGPPRLVVDEGTPKQQPPPGGPGPTPAGGAVVTAVTPPPAGIDKHRKTPTIVPAADMIAANDPGKKKKFSDDAIVESQTRPDPGPPPAIGKSSPKLAFDEGAQKNPNAGGGTRTTTSTGDTSSSSVTPGDTSSNPGGGSNPRLGFDEGAPKGANYSGGAGSGKGKGGGGLAFDESAPKGANLNGAGGSSSSGGSGGGGFGSSFGGVGDDVKNGSGILDDEFFKRIGKVADEERARKRQSGSSLRTNRGSRAIQE